MHLDIFNDDAFSLGQLTIAMNDLPHVAGRLGRMGLFREEGIATTSVSIEKIGLTLSLVPSAARGSSGKPVTNEKRTMRNLSVVHLPQRGAVIADEVQNLRAFGTESEVTTLQTMVNQKLAKMKRDLDVTLEWQRMGAVKGQVLDADGTTVLVDLLAEFGVSQSTLDFVLDSDTTKVKQKCTDLQRVIEDKLGGIQYTGVHVMCSAEFFDALVTHPAVEKAYDRWIDGEFLRNQQRQIGGGGMFEFAGCVFEEYRGKVGSTRFIAQNKAYAIPLGVPDLFVTHYGPADYAETVNTIGLPYYAKQWMEQPGKRVELESQSNPLNICTRPAAVVELSI